MIIRTTRRSPEEEWLRSSEIIPIPDGIYSARPVTDPRDFFRLLSPAPTENLRLSSFFDRFGTLCRATIDRDMPLFCETSGISAIRVEGLTCAFTLLYSGLKAAFTDFRLRSEAKGDILLLTILRDFSGTEAPDTVCALASVCGCPILPFLLAEKIAAVSGFSLSAIARGKECGAMISLTLCDAAPDSITACDDGRLQHAIDLCFSDWRQCGELIGFLQS